ncbi:hypothetical protein GCM10010166_47350 [Couchioplanes caeruleus subsp. azureus]|nr:hypothetical protein GCM10010166_47350 [Couchioplanes caeruleus subsp. azureus]
MANEIVDVQKTSGPRGRGDIAEVAQPGARVADPYLDAAYGKGSR